MFLIYISWDPISLKLAYQKTALGFIRNPRFSYTNEGNKYALSVSFIIVCMFSSLCFTAGLLVTALNSGLPSVLSFGNNSEIRLL